MSNTESRPKVGEIPVQSMPYPGKQADMIPQPDSDLSNYKPAHKLKDKVAIITGGDSGIGRAVAIAFAMEGADVAVMYNQSDDDAHTTRQMVEKHSRQCLVIKGDVRSKQQCQEAISQIIEQFGKLNILVNNAAFQQSHENFEEVSEEEIRRTFETNIFGYMFMAQAALPHLTEGDVIINTSSTTAVLGHPTLIPYSATKGAIHVFTKSLAVNLADRKIRVNAVVPGPVWTPAIPASSPPEALKSWGNIAALGRSGQPEELAPAYVFLASNDSTFVTGSLLEVSGGLISVE
jgi:NAD(P)-dependent dehydrogenase (short-subunit alcohol dehydrogenase family)